MTEIVCLPGDGIGPEVTREACKVLSACAGKYGWELSFTTCPFGGEAIDSCGEPLPEATLEACKRADAVLLGAVGGPKWDGLPHERRPERGLLGIRKALGLFANVRPVKLYGSLAPASPLKDPGDVDMVIFRELTGDLYFGKKGVTGEGDGRVAFDEATYSVHEIRRIAKKAFSAARSRRKHLTSVDKSNVLVTSRLWREVVDRLALEYPDVQVEHQLVDTAAMFMVRRPGKYDVLVTSNMFGDILSDLGGALVGSLGLLPSASLAEGRFGLYEPVHGSAPDIAGRGVANPVGAILSAAMLIEYTLGEVAVAREVERAVEETLKRFRTPDIAAAGTSLVSTAEFGDRVTETIVGGGV
ncbi:MAG: 3-isopropylmalate dehydrogenase [Bacillota bacterium]